MSTSTPPRSTVHACPPDGSGLTPCCNRTPFELHPSDRITQDLDEVTCHAKEAPECRAYIDNASTGGVVHCVFRVGHRDEYGEDHGGPKHPTRGRLRWNDRAVGAVPHTPDVENQTAPGTTAVREGMPSFWERLTELSRLQDGWLDGNGKAPSMETLEAAGRLGTALPRGLSLRVYPTEEGSVQLEWDDQHGGHEIEVLPDGHLFLMTVERIAEDEMRELRAEVAAARKFAAEMRNFCSPHNVAHDYAEWLIEAMDRAKAADPNPPGTPRGAVPAEYVRLKGQLEADLRKMAACAAQPPKPGAEEVRAMQGGITAGICSSLARAIQCFEGPVARGAFLKRVEGDR